MSTWRSREKFFSSRVFHGVRMNGTLDGEEQNETRRESKLMLVLTHLIGKSGPQGTSFSPFFVPSSFFVGKNILEGNGS